MGFGGLPDDPERWRRALLGVVNWKTIVEVSDDGSTWDEVPEFFAGTVTCDTTQQYRWATNDLTVGGLSLDDVSPFHTRFRIRHGIEYRPGDVDLLGMGVYQCTGAAVDTTQNFGIKLTGKSFESYLIKPRGSFPKPRQFRKQSIQAFIEQMIWEVLPRAAITWGDGVNPGQSIPRLQSQDDRWKLIDGQTDDASAARAIGARVFCNGDGGWVVELPHSLGEQPTWTSKRTETSFGATRELSSDGVYNVISVKGESTDGDSPAIGPIVVADVDPHSPTYALLSPDAGGFGQSVRYYSSSMFTSTAQMVRTGQSLLAQALGLKQSISFNRRYDPSILPGSVGAVDTDTEGLHVICDALTYDLGASPSMSGTARTTSALYTGQVAEWNDVEGAGGEDGATS